MGSTLRKRLRQERFESLQDEAVLNLLVAADHVSGQLRGIVKSFGITLPQFNVLRILRGAGPAGHMRCAIAERMIDRSPDVTRLLDRLEAADLVKRFQSRSDRRASMACITSRGLKLLERIQDPMAGVVRSVTECWSEADSRELSRLLEAVYEDAPVSGPPTSDPSPIHP